MRRANHSSSEIVDDHQAEQLIRSGLVCCDPVQQVDDLINGRIESVMVGHRGCYLTCAGGRLFLEGGADDINTTLEEANCC